MKIVIVENEIRIREGLTKLIQKINPQYQVVGEAKDGKEGIRGIIKAKPDLVITDIRMPELDGLEMLNQLREAHIAVKAIVLSAYSEFAYARQAIQLGVSEYLLKPIAINDLSRSLRMIETQLASEQRQQRSLLTMEEILHSVISGDIEPDEKIRNFLSKNYQVNTEGNFVIVLVYLGEKYEAVYQKYSQIIQIILKGIPACYRIIPESQTYSLVIIIFNTEDVKALFTWFKTFFLTGMKKNGLKEFCTGWSSCQDLSHIHEAMKEISNLLDWNIVLGENRIISPDEIAQLQIHPMSYPVVIEDSVRAALCALNTRQFEAGIEEFLRYYMSGRIFSPKEIKESFIRFIWSVLNVAREVVYEKYLVINQQILLEQIALSVAKTELEQVTRMLCNLLPQSIEIPQSGSFLVTRAKNMIHEFYSQGITLEEIAGKINVTPEYLSAQFHSETGINFSTYLKKYRIQKAKELLIGTDLKLYVVSQKAGYSDPKYFCRVFKEITGQSPSDYRKTNR